MSSPDRDRRPAGSETSDSSALVSGPVPKKPAETEASNAQGDFGVAVQLELDGLAPSEEPAVQRPQNDNAVSGTHQVGRGALHSGRLELEAPLRIQVSKPNDARALLRTSEPSGRAPKRARLTGLSTRHFTHVPPQQWFDRTLPRPGTGNAALDLRQRLAWRFKAAFAAWKELLPLCPTPDLRAELITSIRGYELLIRRSGVAAPTAKRLSDALHARLTDTQALECDRALSRLEGLLLNVDQSLTDDSFRAHFERGRTPTKTQLRYARFLAARPFGIGYRRDRFEALALALLSARSRKGELALMPRDRAGQWLLQLLRGVDRAKVKPAELAFLRDSLDRLERLGSAQELFDSGFIRDVYGFKIATHDRMTSPEFLYLSVALEVELHNRLHAFCRAEEEDRRDAALSEYDAQRHAQREAVQAMFANFQRPLALHSAGLRRPSRPGTPLPNPAHMPSARRTLRLVWTCAAVLIGLATQLAVTGHWRTGSTSHHVRSAELEPLSPLLRKGRVMYDGTTLTARLTSAAWRELPATQREEEARRLAQALQQRGVTRAEVYADDARVLHIEAGQVRFVDATP